MQIPFMEMKGITKRYGGVTALQDVHFSCNLGTIHAILGENGAGKSTLIKVLSGVVQPDSGTMTLDGAPVQFNHPLEANEAGIVCIFQELSLLPELSVADNICITDSSRRLGLIDHKTQRRRTEALLAQVGCEDINPLEWVNNLPLSRRQMVEIAKALGRNPKLLILDEATSALTGSDVERVYEILRKLRDKDGLSLLYISHRMHEIEELADVCSVFRNGQHIKTFPRHLHNDEEIVQLMIGREMKRIFPKKPQWDISLPTVLEVEKLSWINQLQDISFTVGKGEIVGIGGLDGQGQRELLLALFGVLKDVQGVIRIDGKPVQIRTPSHAKSLRKKMALVPEDRKMEGLMLAMSIAENISMASLSHLQRYFIIEQRAESNNIQDMIEKLKIKVGNVRDAVSTLSGGNQQKVVIAKWLMTGAQIILLNDPTRGIDVATKQEIYQLLRDLADAGTSILFYTTDYDELIGSCDRVLILYQGKIVSELKGENITETNIISNALNLPLGQKSSTTGQRL